MRRSAILAVALLAVAASACGETPGSADPQRSFVADGKYTNEFFGLTLEIPDGWAVASDDSQKHVREVGENVAVGDDPAMKAAVEAARKTTFQLLMVSEFPLGAAVEFNPSLILMAERVAHAPGVKSGKDYLYHTSNGLMRTALPYELVREAYPTTLGSEKWHRADFVIRNPHLPIEQSYFAIHRGEFVLSVILSAATDEQMAELERIAGSIRL